MNVEEQVKKDKKSIQILKERRGGMSPELKEHIRDLNVLRKKILTALKEKEKTPIEISKEIGESSDKVFWYLMAMKKYGDIIEVREEGDYYCYAIKQ